MCPFVSAAVLQDCLLKGTAPTARHNSGIAMHWYAAHLKLGTCCGVASQGSAEHATATKRQASTKLCGVQQRVELATATMQLPCWTRNLGSSSRTTSLHAKPQRPSFWNPVHTSIIPSSSRLSPSPGCSKSSLPATPLPPPEYACPPSAGP